MRRSATNRKLEKAHRKAVDACARYLINNRKHLDYQQALEQGHPLATGVIEGGCRYFVKERMDRTGAQWSLDGAEAVLQLRSLRVSGDFEEYWEYHLAREHQRNHSDHYQGQVAPDPLPLRSQRKQILRRIK